MLRLRIYLGIFIFSSSILFSCEEEKIDTRISNQLRSQVMVSCDTSVYGEDCNNSDDFILIKKDELKAENIKKDVVIGGVSGTAVGGEGNYQECISDNEIGCITTETYRSLDIEPYLGSILSSTLILGRSGSIEDCDDNSKFKSCYIRNEEFKAVDTQSLVSSNIKLGVRFANVEGSYSGIYSGCNADGVVGCITTETFKGIDINNHLGKVISSASILGKSGTFVLPNRSSVLQTASYGVNSNLSGSLSYCSGNDSGCYLKSYSLGVSGNQLQAIDYDDLKSKTSYIKNGYTLVSGIVGNQSSCSGSDYNCYIEGNSFKAVESEKLIASNIKYGVNLGGVTGSYTGDYLSCSDSSHTNCIADSSYPSVPSNYTNSLLSSASINGIEGNIGTCDAGGSSCYILNDTFTAVESNKLVESNIRHNVSLGNVNGSYNGDNPECSVDGGTGCITTDTYKAIDINNHRSKILSSSSIFGISGTFVLPHQSSVLQGETYGVNSSLSGTLAYCSTNGSGCYLKEYSQGVPGNQLKALDYDDISSKRSNIKNGYTFISGIVGEQSECSVGDSNCYIKFNSLIAVESDKLIESNIKHDISIAGVAGSYSGEYADCSMDGESGCIATSTYKAININNHRNKIISSESIFDTSGTFVIPSASVIVQSCSYGVNGGLSGFVPYCSVNSSGCYVKTYSEGLSGYQLKALDYDDIYSKKSSIKGGYELVYGITGTQPQCLAGGNNCYINSDFKAVESSNLIASYIKHDLSLGGVTGNYGGDYLSCSGSSHTSCLADASYPSMPSWFTSSLLSSASINGVNGDVDECSSGESFCYISSNSLKAAESSRLASSNIKHGITIGGIIGDYIGNHLSCSGSNHTDCIADSSYPSVPSTLKNSLLSSASINGVDGEIGICSSGDSSCYIDSNSLKAAESSLLISSNIKQGVSVGGISGGYPSAMNPLMSATATTDLTSSNFNSSLLSSSEFEWFDSNGNRYSNRGSSDLVATNIKEDVNIFGVVGNYSVPSDEDIVISSNNADILVDETVDFSVTVYEADVTSSTSWSSSNDSILRHDSGGSFTAVGVGSVNITASGEGFSKTISVSVHLLPATISGDRYSSLVFGLEGCASNAIDSYWASFSVDSNTFYCNGDCDDAYFNIHGDNDVDLTLGIYNDKLYLISNRDQNLMITSFTESTSEWGNQTQVNNNSYLVLDIKNRDGNVVDSKNFVIFPEKGNNTNLTEYIMQIHAGEYIDVTTHFEGTKVSDLTCPATVNFSSLLRSKVKNQEQTGFWLVGEGTTKVGHQTKKITE